MRQLFFRVRRMLSAAIRNHASFPFLPPTHSAEDVLQEVYVVVHRRLASYDRQCKLTTWLFAICLRVANRHRRRHTTLRFPG